MIFAASDVRTSVEAHRGLAPYDPPTRAVTAGAGVDRQSVERVT
jgi:hypothetical protein